MVFYFTGTGNSLYVARQLEQEPISIPQEMNKEKRVYEAEAIGIVCPDYAGELPRMVKRFILTSTFKADYFYMVITYGKDQSVSAEWGANFAAKTGIKVDYTDTVLMVDNYLPVFDMEAEMAMDKKVEEQIAVIREKIQARHQEIPTPSEQGRALYHMAQRRDIDHPELNSGRLITVSDGCIGCGVCANVCPVGNFYVGGGVAKRKRETCEFCQSCAQNCPQKAITVCGFEKNPSARYRNEHVSLSDIIRANKQD